MRRLHVYTRGIIYLTCRSPRTPPNGVDQRTELQQIVDAEPGPSGRCLREEVGLGRARPSRQHRAEMVLGVEVHHSVLAPVQAPSDQHEAGTAPRVKGVRDLETDCLAVNTACSC